MKFLFFCAKIIELQSKGFIAFSAESFVSFNNRIWELVTSADFIIQCKFVSQNYDAEINEVFILDQIQLYC